MKTDDPHMFGTDLNNEYMVLHREQGFPLEELHRIGLGSIETSLISASEKKRLRDQFNKEYARLV